LLDVWYSRVDAVAVLRLFRNAQIDMERSLDKARSRTALQALSKLAAVREGRIRLVETPPLVSHVDDESLSVCVRRLMAGYYPTLSDDRRELIQRYRFVDFALKVVGVGSVGTRCFIVLLDSSHHRDPLLLQIKEACTSVLEPHAGRSVYHNHGRRVVAGQHLIQSASDIFLGWSSDGSHDYYVRQLRDMKGTADLSAMTGADLIVYAELCGWVLARAHARSGDASRIAGYLGKSGSFEDAIARFAKAFADQNESDYEAFQAAVRAGRLPAETGV
jgi:uncharacterized protein (DUF2252 family)